MLIQKNDSTKSVTIFPSGKLISPDETIRSAGLFYEQLTLIGKEYSNYTDFQQPVIKSYIVDVTTGGTTNVFQVLSQITLPEQRTASRINICVTDGTSLITPPKSTIKIYTNLVDATEVVTLSPPFSYLMSSSFSFNNIKKQLNSIWIQNETGSTIKAFVQIMQFTENDDNYGSAVLFTPPVAP